MQRIPEEAPSIISVPVVNGDLWRTMICVLTAAEWAFRWLCNFPEVATVLSGTSNIEQTLDNLRIFDGARVGCMSEEELEIVAKARELYRKRIKVDCTGCAYCMPCPADVNIPNVFAMWNNSYKYGWKDHHYYGLKNEGHGADKCVSCGKCMEVCPQQLKIPKLMAEAKEYFDN